MAQTGQPCPDRTKSHQLYEVVYDYTPYITGANNILTLATALV